MVATESSVATHSCSFEYLSPGGTSMSSSKRSPPCAPPACRSSTAPDPRPHICHQARRKTACQVPLRFPQVGAASVARGGKGRAAMIVGVPTEIKPDERRVALTPAGAAVLRSHGHRVLVQSGAGAGSGHSDREYQAAGAQIVRAAAAVWARARMVLKVKEPQPSEFRFLRPDLVLFTYLHLAAEPRLARELVRRGTTALGYETVQLADGSLPLLAPMSEVAGRLAIQVGGWCLEAQNGGDGVLLSGAAGVRPGRVAVLGGGIAGANAARVAAGVGAEVTILDVNPTRLRYLSETLEGRITTVMSNRATIEEEVL